MQFRSGSPEDLLVVNQDAAVDSWPEFLDDYKARFKRILRSAALAAYGHVVGAGIDLDVAPTPTWLVFFEEAGVMKHDAVAAKVMRLSHPPLTLREPDDDLVAGFAGALIDHIETVIQEAPEPVRYTMYQPFATVGVGMDWDGSPGTNPFITKDEILGLTTRGNYYVKKRVV